VHTENRSEEALLTPEELAEYLKCGRTFAYRLLASGAIPSLKVGRLRRIRRSDAALFVEKRVMAAREQEAARGRF
jgi:excisionase family DNA binding protein